MNTKKSKNTYWTSEDDDRLKELILSHADIEIIQSEFQNRSLVGLRRRAKHIGIQKEANNILNTRVHWTIEDDEILKKEWCFGVTQESICQIFPHRTFQSIVDRANRIGLPCRTTFIDGKKMVRRRNCSLNNCILRK
jgi:hypothetical protein